MGVEVPRLRMFAGPNGSGKSTLKSVIRPDLLGYYINADEIEAALTSRDGFHFALFDLEPTADDIRGHLLGHGLRRHKEFSDSVLQLKIDDGHVFSSKFPGSAYIAAALADLIRLRLLASKASFSFETVMSSQDKVELMKAAKENGYRTYLYYIATSDPAINVSRVANRVHLGGHDVPTDKIYSRYSRSLDLLADAIKVASRAYIFDNSTDGSARVWIAEFTDGKEIEIKVDRVPEWFNSAVLTKLV